MEHAFPLDTFSHKEVYLTLKAFSYPQSATDFRAGSSDSDSL